MEDRRRFFALMGAVVAAGSAQPAAAKLPDKVMQADAAEKLEFPFGVQHIHFRGPTDMLSNFEGGSLALRPGMEPHPPHQHPDEEILLVCEGTGEISVEDEVTQVGPGSMMYTAANKLHGIKNTGSDDMLFYYFKWKK